MRYMGHAHIDSTLSTLKLWAIQLIVDIKYYAPTVQTTIHPCVFLHLRRIDLGCPLVLRIRQVLSIHPAEV
jgi:hypothetical protein